MSSGSVSCSPRTGGLCSSNCTRIEPWPIASKMNLVFVRSLEFQSGNGILTKCSSVLYYRTRCPSTILSISMHSQRPSPGLINSVISLTASCPSLLSSVLAPWGICSSVLTTDGWYSRDQVVEGDLALSRSSELCNERNFNIYLLCFLPRIHLWVSGLLWVQTELHPLSNSSFQALPGPWDMLILAWILLEGHFALHT